MDGTKANLVLSDPPYNVDVEETAGKIKNDNMPDDKFYQFLFAAFVNMEQMMFFYRLYYADWYLALYMLVNGLVYSSIGAWLGAKTGSKLQQVMGE